MSSDLWPTRLALLVLAFVSCSQIARSSSHVSRRVLQNGRPGSDGTIKGMGWVITNFPLKWRTSCDPTSYHSSLALNITRPDRTSFCFKISSRLPAVTKYSCQQAASVGQVGRIQVLVAPGCGDAVVDVTIDGQSWSSFAYDNASSILTIDRIATLPPIDATKPADRSVCLRLQGNGTCDTVTSFCAPSYGPDPACAVLVSDNRAVCCPVNRVSYDEAVVEGPMLFRLYGKFSGGCETISNDSEVRSSVAAQYRTALGLPHGSVQALSYTCRAGRMSVVIRISGLKMDAPDLIVQRSAVLLKPLASLLGLVGIRASYYSFPPPDPARPPRRPPLRPRSPPPSPPPVPPPPSTPLSSSRTPPSSQPGPSHYASRPPPVYGVY